MVKLMTYLIFTLIITVLGWEVHCAELRPQSLLDNGKYIEFSSNDELHMIVALEDIPSSVANFDLFYRADPPQLPKSFLKPLIKKIEINKSVKGLQRITFFIQLFYNNGIMCSEKKIINAVLNPEQNDSEGRCSNIARYCGIKIDFDDTCDVMQQQISDACTYKDNASYVCTSQAKNHLINAHNWNQLNADGDFGTEPVHTSKSQYIIQLMEFDKNTEIVNRIGNETDVYSKINWLPNNPSIYEYNISNTVPYSENTEVQYDCRSALLQTNYVHVAVIDKTGRNISLYKYTTDLRKNFKMADNGTMLCCLFYSVNKTGAVKTVTRFVQNITLLYYEKNAVDLENDPPYIIYYIISSVVGIIIILFLIIIIIRRLCYKKRILDDTMELQTSPNTNPNTVLYADLDLPGERERKEVNTNEESNYVEIIGILKDKN